VLVVLTSQAGNRAPPARRIDMSRGNHPLDPNRHAQTLRHWERRDFVKSVAALAGAAGLSTYDMRSAAAEPLPEVTKIRFAHTPAICLAPQYVAEELLRLEGFSEVKYVPQNYTVVDVLAQGLADLSMEASPTCVTALDESKAIVLLAGIHAGCYELFGREKVQAIPDLRGKTVAISAFGASEHVFVSSMVAYVGMNPANDVNWLVAGTNPDAMRLFIDGKADAFLGFAPQPQELRAKRVGRLIVNTGQDRPWSQYFCCSLAANRDFVAKNPIATKRAVRALLKAADICAREPERVATMLRARGYEPRYEIGLEVLKSLPYNRWREANPEDTIRFHALRLHEVGMIKSSPQKIIAQGTDWRFLNELKRELKA
jgi:NitT/TauT family transport system substrate-binding protein